jgi:hypothetical protein
VSRGWLPLTIGAPLYTFILRINLSKNEQSEQSKITIQ